MFHSWRGSITAPHGVALLLLGLVVGGCPSATPPVDNNNTNGNDNTVPNPLRVEVTIIGEGEVTQTEAGDLIILLAIGDPGWAFDRWSNAEIDNPEENPITVDIETVPSISVTFIRVDTDRDGVADLSDDCPETPAGATDVNADGCAPSERDSDGDGVNDDLDQCADTPAEVLHDENGCPIGDPTTGDDDVDGVPNNIDQCLETPAGATVDANGCATSELDSDGDSVTDDRDRCENTPPNTEVDNFGCPVDDNEPPPPPPPTCGNGSLDAGEECDGAADGNCPGECQADCRCPTVPPFADNCADAVTITQGVRTFNSLGATTDGPDHPGICSFFGSDAIESDIWFKYVADCTGPAIASLCGSDFDTKLAVYASETCPPGSPVACSDDDCGSGFTSRAEFTVITGRTYLIRVGGFDGAQGEGQLTVLCNVDACENAAGACFEQHAGVGCDDAACCHTTCDADAYCCDVTWDDICAAEAVGLCTGNFAACTSTAGSCGSEHGGAGCGDVECCNAVCLDDPFCCVDTWDDICVDAARATCFLTCGGESGSCFLVHANPGCQDVACCETVCAIDAFCCSTDWDQECANAAATQCR